MEVQSWLVIPHCGDLQTPSKLEERMSIDFRWQGVSEETREEATILSLSLFPGPCHDIVRVTPKKGEEVNHGKDCGSNRYGLGNLDYTIYPRITSFEPEIAGKCI